MYAEPHAEAAAELVRVTGPGGHIAFTAWTPSSVYPTMGQVMLPYPAAGDVPDIGEPPFLWSDPGVVEERLQTAVADLTVRRRSVSYLAMSPAHFGRETIRLSGVFG